MKTGTSYPFLVTDCLRKLLTTINIADSVSEKLTKDEQSPLIRRQVVWNNCFEQITEKQKSVKTCTESQKKKHLPFMEILVASTKERNVDQIKQVSIG